MKTLLLTGFWNSLKLKELTMHLLLTNIAPWRD